MAYWVWTSKLARANDIHSLPLPVDWLGLLMACPQAESAEKRIYSIGGLQGGL
jgi:hypothetical protein